MDNVTDNITAILKAVDDEPEFPGDMPDELWERWKSCSGRSEAAEELRAVVRLTKAGIHARIAAIDIPPDDVLPTLASLSGIAPNATGDMQSEDFVREIRSGVTASAMPRALAEAIAERDALRREASHYREALERIEVRAHLEATRWPPKNRDVLFALSIKDMTDRALLWEGRERKRTWRDRLRARWQTWMART